MGAYIFFGGIIALLSVISQQTGNSLKKPLMAYLVVLSLFLIGCRYYVGTDWANYKFFYENGYSNATIDGTQEIGYTIWNKVLAWFGIPTGLYFAITGFLSLYQLYIASKLLGIENKCLVFLIYFCLFLPSLQFNIVRTGLLGSCIMLSFAYKSRRENTKSWIWLIVGCTMHYMGVIFIPLWFFIDLKLKRKWVIFIFAAAVIIYVIGIVGVLNQYLSFVYLLDARASEYVDNADEGYGLSVGMIFNILFFFYLYLKFYNQYCDDVCFRILLNTYFIAIFLSIALSDLAIFVARLGQVLNMSLIFLWPFFTNKISKTKKARAFKIIGIYILLFLYCTFYLLRSVGYGDDSETNMYPYEYKVEQLFTNQV